MPKAKKITPLTLEIEGGTPIVELTWTTVPRKYKIVRAPTWDRLELLVNEFISNPDNSRYEFVGGPVKLGNEEYLQCLAQASGKVLA
jgi:hypothetical protein